MDDHFKHPADEKKVKFRHHLLNSKKENVVFVVSITLLSFAVSVGMTVVSSKIMSAISNNIIALSLVLIIIVISIIFDIIGMAVASADEAPFHAMASRKLYGAKQAINLLRNADRVATFCNDVIGDICGVISGAASAYIIYRIAEGASSPETTLAGLTITGMVASLTIGGKAVGKSIAIENCNYIVYKVSVVLKFVTGRFSFLNTNKKKKRKEKVKVR